MIDEGEQIPAQTAHVGMDHGQDGIRRDRGVYGVAAFLEDLNPGQRGERVGRGHHASATQGHGPVALLWHTR